MRALLLPVKDLRNAKQRLVGILTPEERFALAHAMLADTVPPCAASSAPTKFLSLPTTSPRCKPPAKTAGKFSAKIAKSPKASPLTTPPAASNRSDSPPSFASRSIFPLIQSRDIDELLAIECSAPADRHRPLARRHRHQRHPPHSSNALPFSLRLRQLRKTLRRS